MTQTLGGDCIRTLVVEDNRDICENIGEYLDARGHITDYATMESAPCIMPKPNRSML